MRKFTVEFDNDVPTSTMVNYARMAYLDATGSWPFEVITDVGQGEHFNGLPLGWIGVRHDQNRTRPR